MDCAKFRELLDNYENLSDEEKLSLAEHTVVCDECKKEYDFFLSVIASVKGLPKLTAPDDFVQSVRARVAGERKRDRIAASLRRNWYKYSSVAACLIVAIVIGANSDMLVSKMHPADDGVVISERKTADRPENENGAAPLQTAEPKEDNTNEEPKTSEDNPSERQKKEETSDKTASPSITAVPASAYTNTVTAQSNAVRNTTPAAPSGRTYSNNTASAPSYTQTPVSEPTVAAGNDGGETQTFTNEAQETVQTVTETNETASGTEESESNTTQSYALERNRYRIPSAYSDSAKTASTGTEDQSSGYSISESGGMTLSAAGTPQSSEDSVHISGSIYVDIKYVDEFISVMNSYITGSEEDYYLIDSSSLPAMFAELSAMGVSYGDFIESFATGEIAFNVVYF